LQFSGDWYSVANVIRPKLFSEELKCVKIHFTAETAENVTKTHFDIIIKKADGTEKHIEGRGQAFKPGFASSSSVAFKSPKDNKWHSKCLYTMSSKTQPTNTGWTFEKSEFDSRQGNRLSILHSVQTGCWAQPASYTMGTGGCFPGSKAAGA
jgi:hypothetical protein